MCWRVHTQKDPNHPEQQGGGWCSRKGGDSSQLWSWDAKTSKNVEPEADRAWLLWNHRMTERLGLERTFRDHPVQPSCVGRDTSSPPGCSWSGEASSDILDTVPWQGGAWGGSGTPPWPSEERKDTAHGAARMENPECPDSRDPPPGGT